MMKSRILLVQLPTGSRPGAFVKVQENIQSEFSIPEILGTTYSIFVVCSFSFHFAPPKNSLFLWTISSKISSNETLSVSPCGIHVKYGSAIFREWIMDTTTEIFVSAVDNNEICVHSTGFPAFLNVFLFPKEMSGRSGDLVANHK